jgi:hypothetical protein
MFHFYCFAVRRRKKDEKKKIEVKYKFKLKINDNSVTAEQLCMRLFCNLRIYPFFIEYQFDILNIFLLSNLRTVDDICFYQN